MRRLGGDARRMLGVLAHSTGDHVDRASLAVLARVGRPETAVSHLSRWHLVEEPMAGRYALHAVVKHAVLPRTKLSPARLFEHYVSLLERHPERLGIEQTHLFAAMDHAHRTGELSAMLRIEALLAKLDG
jgi:hypothetical protein